MLYSDDGYPLKLIPNQGKATTTTTKTPLVPQVIHELLETVIDCKPHMFSLTVFFTTLSLFEEIHSRNWECPH